MAETLAEAIKRRKVAEEWLSTDTSDNQKDDPWVHWPTVLEAGEPAPTPYVKTEEAPAPEKLDQVERGQLVRLPPQAAPDILPQVERGELVKAPEPAAPSARFIGSEQGMDVGPTGPASKVYTGSEEEGGQRYVIDPESGQKVPYAELATEADKAAQPPGGVPLQKVTVTGEPEVRRAELLTDPDVDLDYFKTPLSTGEETKFQAWVKKNNIPFDDSPQSDYDMRGYWKAAQAGDPTAKRAANLHFPDTYKTPFHKTFSNESQYATPDAPHWEGDRLIDKDGNLVADETPGAKPPRAALIPTPPAVKPAVPVTQPSEKVPAVKPVEIVTQPSERGPAVKPVEIVAQPSERAPGVKLAEPQAPDFADRAKQWQTGMRAYGFEARINPDGTWTGVRTDGKEMTPEQNKGLYRFGANLSKQYGFSGQEEKLGVLEDVAAAPAVKRAEAIPAPPAVSTEEPAITNQAQPGSYRPYQGEGQRRIQNVVIHSSDGHEKGDINTLTQGGVSSHYYTTEDGRSLHFVSDNDIAYHAGKNIDPSRYSNEVTIGIEQEHIDGQPWKEAEVKRTAQTAAELIRRYPYLSINNFVGHSDIAPGRKQDPLNFPWDRFRGYVKADLAGQPVAAEAKGPAWQSWATVDKEGKEIAPAQAPRAVSAEPGKVVVQKTGFYESEDPSKWPTGKATTFGYKDLLDPGVGSKHLGELSTNNQVLHGVAVPEFILRNTFGNNWAAMRKARVDVVDTTTGQRLRLPIVDVGPGAEQVANGVVVDMTAATDKYFNNQGGAHQFKVNIVPNVGPDVNSNPQAFWDEQAAIRSGIDTGAKGRPAQKPASAYWQTWEALDPKIQAIANESAAAKRQVQQNTITALPESQNNNVIGLYKRLDKPVENVPDAMRKQVQANLKPQIIAQMRERFPEIKSDAEAWDKAQSNTGIIELSHEFGSKIMGYIQRIESVTRKSGANTDQFAVNRFLETVLPKGSEADKHELLSKLYAMPHDQRAAEIEARLGPGFVEPGNPNKDPQFLSEAMTRLTDPNFQQRKADELTKLQAEMRHNLRDDPRLRGTWAEKVVDNAAQLITSIPQLATPAMWPFALAQVSAQMSEAAKAEHPEWDEKTLTDNATRATLVTFFGQLAANKLLMMGIGPLLGAGVSPAKRIIAQALTAVAGQPAIAAGTQAATNIATGQPIGKGVGEAAESGLIQGVIGGIPHVGGEIIAGRRGAPVTERPPVAKERPPVEERPPVPPALSRIEGMNVPDYVKDTLRQDFGLAQKLGIVEKIEQLAADRRTAQQTALALKIPGDRSEQNRLIRSVRAVLGIPSMDDATAFAQWLSNRRHLPRAVPVPREQTPVGFTTSLGSTYQIHEDGTTTRNKAYRPEHGIAEQGPQERSQQTIFVTPADAQKLGEIQVKGGPKTIIAPLGDGRYGIKYLEGPSAGKFERRSVVNIRPTPEIGLIPVEMWEGGSRTHFGNEITDVRRSVLIPPPVTKEDVHRRAYELYDERTKNGQPGTALDDWKQAQQELSQAKEPIPVTQGEAEPWVSAIANRFTAERVARGEIGEVIPGEGYSKEELLAKGLQMGPEQINQHVSDLMNNRGGDPKLQAGAVRAEEARLSQRSNAASRAAEANPGNAQLQADEATAFHDLTDFHNGPVAKLKNNWHAQGMTLQGEVPLDLSTFNGLRERFLRENGQAPPKNMEPQLRKIAKAMEDATAADRDAMSKLSKEIERQSARRLPTDEDVRNRIMEAVKDYPCRT